MSESVIKKLINKNNFEYFHKEISISTMDEVRNYLIKHKRNCIFLADKQLNGKGQRGKNWSSPIGNIYCSIGFQNLFDIKDHFIYSMLVAVSIRMTLEKFNIDNITFKWPNDIFYKNMKFSGIISESISLDKVLNFIIVGFGVNINSSPKLAEYPTTFVKNFSGVKNISSFLEIFFNIFFINLNKI